MDGTLIYAKTPKGVAEVAARTAQLSMTTRRVLIMMDGKRTIDELAALVRPGEIEAIVDQLEGAGLAQKAAGAASSEPSLATSGRDDESRAPTTINSPGMDDRELTPITLEEAKRRAVRELNDRLGPDADLVAIRIENCRTIEDFRERVRDAERFVTAALGAAAAQDYLRALRRKP